MYIVAGGFVSGPRIWAGTGCVQGTEFGGSLCEGSRWLYGYTASLQV